MACVEMPSVTIVAKKMLKSSIDYLRLQCILSVPDIGVGSRFEV